MTEYLRNLSYVVAVSLWLGGLTFYALVVVPTGTEVVGGTLQGFITQRVTWQLNVLGVVCLAGMLPVTATARRPSLWVAWSLMAVAQAALFYIHSSLSGLLDFATHTVPDPSGFYSLHRVYLLFTALQWCACVGHVSAAVRSWKRVETDMKT